MFKPIIEKPLNGGIQKIFSFPNGYGASVVKHSFSYGGSSGLWELAVLKINSVKPLDFDLCYTTPITNDVIGHLDDEEVQEKLRAISELEADE